MWKKNRNHACRNIVHTVFYLPGDDEDSKCSRANANPYTNSLPKAFICPVNYFIHTVYNASGLVFENTQELQCKQKLDSVVIIDIDQTGEWFPLMFISFNLPRSLYSFNSFRSKIRERVIDLVVNAGAQTNGCRFGNTEGLHSRFSTRIRAFIIRTFISETFPLVHFKRGYKIYTDCIHFTCEQVIL